MEKETYSFQLFGGKGHKALWALLLGILVAGLIGTFWDLSEANILGTGQGLDSASAALMVIIPVAIIVTILLVTFFHREQRAKRGVQPFVPFWRNLKRFQR